MHHPVRDQLLAFAAGSASDSEAERIYAHLDECPVCTDRLRAINSIRAGFDAAWERILEEIPPPDGAARAPRVAPLLLLARGVLDGGRRLATAAAALANDAVGLGGLRGAFVPAVAGVGDPGADAGGATLLEEASRLCGAGDFAGALAALERGAAVTPAGVREGRVQLTQGSRPVGEIFIDADRRVLAILLEADAAGPGGAVVRVECAAEAAPRQVRLREVEGQARLLAEFADLPDGPFHVQIEFDAAG